MEQMNQEKAMLITKEVTGVFEKHAVFSNEAAAILGAILAYISINSNEKIGDDAFVSFFISFSKTHELNSKKE